MRVLIISHTYPPALNGQAVFTSNLAEGLARQGQQVRVLVPAIDRPAFEMRNGVEIQGVSAIDLRFIHKDLSLALASRSQAERILQEFKPDLIHLQDPSPISQVCLQLAKQRHIPVLATHHPGPAIWAPYLPGDKPVVSKLIVPLIWFFFIHYLNKADRVCAPSQAAANMLATHGVKKPLKAITCGVRLEEFDTTAPEQPLLRKKFGLPPDKKLFVYVGRLDEEKKVEVLIGALPLLKDPASLLVVAGTGTRQKSLQDLAAALAVADRVIFLGNVQRAEIPDLYSACDIFVMPGDVESLSISTLEALASGKPVIAANAMALPEMVLDRKNGFLFRPGDSADLARKMDWMAAGAAGWAGMAAISRRIVQRHSFPATIQAYEALYRHMIENPPQEKPAWSLPPLPVLPGWLGNYHFLFTMVQWAALLAIVIISLLTHNQPVSAAPNEPILVLNPEVVADIRHFLNVLKQFDFPDHQANGMQLIFQNMKFLLNELKL
jgi:glycosyltransferase involved in cell wall biosynthesis